MGERGEIKTILAKIIAPPACRRAIIDETRQRLSNELGRDIEVDFEYEDSRHAKRLYLLLIAVSANDFRLGRGWLFDEKFRNPMDASGRLVKRVVGELVGELEHGGCVDEFMRDQIVVFQALAEGRCEIDVGRGEDGTHVLPSLHTKTAEWVAGQVLGIVVREDGLEEGSAYVVPGIEDDIKDDDHVQKLAEGV
jgi:RNA 3'-terminal phosphate cyclase (ATP)